MFKITAHIKSRFLNLIGGIFLFCFVVLLCLTAKKNLAQFFGRILMRLIILVCWAGTISLRALCPKIPRKRALAPFLVVSSHTISKFSSLSQVHFASLTRPLDKQTPLNIPHKSNIQETDVGSFVR